MATQYKVISICERVQYDENDVETGRTQEAVIEYWDDTAGSPFGEKRTKSVEFDHDTDAALQAACTTAVEADLGIV